MEWERGEETPGRVMANLKTSGLREVLEQLAEAAGSPDSTSPDSTSAGEASPADVSAAGTSAEDAAPEWTPTV